MPHEDYITEREDGDVQFGEMSSSSLRKNDVSYTIDVKRW